MTSQTNMPEETLPTGSEPRVATTLPSLGGLVPPDELAPSGDLLPHRERPEHLALLPGERWIAPTMFLVALGFLVCLAGALQETRGGATLPEGTNLYWWGLAMLWPLMGIELVANYWRGSPRWAKQLWFILLPPLRLAGRDQLTGHYLWLPLSGWFRVNRESRVRLERIFGLPMVLAALLVLPILGVEYLWAHHLATNLPFAFLLDTTTSLIWLAFTVEFIIMVSIAERKLRYCGRNWLDLVVILLPMVAFVRILRLTQLGRLHQLSKVSRVYRLRGVSTRVYRGAIALDLVRYVVRQTPQKRLARLREELAEKQHEVNAICAEIAMIEALLAAAANNSAATYSATAGKESGASGESSAADTSSMPDSPGTLSASDTAAHPGRAPHSHLMHQPPRLRSKRGADAS